MDNTEPEAQAQEPDQKATPQPPPNSLENDMQMREALQNELNQSEASIEQNFAKSCAESLSADDEELFFSDKESFIKLILQKQNEFIKSEITPKIEALNELDSQIEQKKSFAEIEGAQEAFMQAHPDVDMQTLMSFYSQDLPPRYKNELDKLSPNEFFDALYRLYQSAQESAPKEEQESLPQRLDGVPSGEQGSSESTIMNRF